MTENRLVQWVGEGDLAREGSARPSGSSRGRGVGARGLVNAKFGTEGKDFVQVEGKEVAAVGLWREEGRISFGDHVRALRPERGR